jgi:hypothetical protein
MGAPAGLRCFRCSRPVECPAVGEGVVGDQDETRVPLSVACLALLLVDPQAFWDGRRQARGRAGAGIGLDGGGLTPCGC